MKYQTAGTGIKIRKYLLNFHLRKKSVIIRILKSKYYTIKQKVNV